MRRLGFIAPAPLGSLGDQEVPCYPMASRPSETIARSNPSQYVSRDTLTAG